MRVKLGRIIPAITVLMLSGNVFAGAPPSPRIFFEPAAFSPVPAMSETMLIALGVLLVVMAMRFMRESKGALKSVVGAVFISGLLMGGYGIDRTLATGELTVTGNECTQGGNQGFDGTRLAWLESQCANPIIVTEIRDCQNPSYEDPGQPDCLVNTILGSSGDRCHMPRCEREEF